MQSLKAVAELAYRRVYPDPGADVPHEIEEFIETAKQKYAYLVWRYHLDQKKDPDFSLGDTVLSTKPLDVTRNEGELPYVTIEAEILDLPHDAGLYFVKPKSLEPCGAMVKTTISKMDLFCDNKHTRKRYYRVGKKIYFPDGFDCGDVKTVDVTVISIDNMDEDDTMLSTPFADLVREGVVAAYMSTGQRAEDTAANRSANEEAK